MFFFSHLSVSTRKYPQIILSNRDDSGHICFICNFTSNASSITTPLCTIGIPKGGEDNGIEEEFDVLTTISFPKYMIDVNLGSRNLENTKQERYQTQTNKK